MASETSRILILTPGSFSSAAGWHSLLAIILSSISVSHTVIYLGDASFYAINGPHIFDFAGFLD